MTETLVQLPVGTIRGRSERGAKRYLDVPYAAPPEGELRFAEPAAVTPWGGIREATRVGALAPQARPPRHKALDVAPIAGSAWTPGSADYLTLNLWRPDDDRADLPVMVFIHGGGFVSGSKDVPLYDGSSFARSGIVCIVINYRLGAEGFLPIAGAPTNLGLRDQLAALRWVQGHVHLFGGDAGNVTVFGESAGAVSIACLLASPLSKGLFRRVVIQSGHGLIRRDIPTAQRVVRKLASILRVSPDVASFRSVPPERLVAAQRGLTSPFSRLDLRDEDGIDPFFGISVFSPVYGDDVLPKAPQEALREGAGAGVDMLIGTNAEEMNAFTVPTGVARRLPAFLASYWMRRFFPHARKLLKAYGMGGNVRPGLAFTAAANDLVFRAPTRDFAAAHQGRTFFYEFEWRSPALDGALGAAHALELPFVFNNLGIASGKNGLLGQYPPQDLADRVHALWARFACDGALPWSQFSSTHRNVYLLGKAVEKLELPFPAETILLSARHEELQTGSGKTVSGGLRTVVTEDL